MYTVREFQNFLVGVILVHQGLCMQSTVHWLSRGSEQMNKIHSYFMNDRLSSQEYYHVWICRLTCSYRILFHLSYLKFFKIAMD